MTAPNARAFLKELNRRYSDGEPYTVADLLETLAYCDLLLSDRGDTRRVTMIRRIVVHIRHHAQLDADRHRQARAALADQLADDWGDE